jgi:outer membrane protein assembly factor BamD
VENDRHAKDALGYSENAKRDYAAALEAFDAHNWESATQLLTEVRRKYGYSRYARLAELRLADADYLQEKFAESISSYKSFVHDYPNDPEVPYARYQIARAQYESVSQSVLLPPLEERDLAAVNDAHATIRGYLNDYPNSDHSNELRYMLSVVVGLLARHELYVARYYVNKDRFAAGISRVEYALRTFHGSGLEPEALVLLAEIHMKLKERDKARAVLERMLAEYPDSAFAVPARRFLKELGEPVATIRIAN